MITFGELGWFGVISEDVGFETISIVAQAVADYLNDMLQPGPVVLAYDTRFLSREYAWSIQRVLTANRIKVILHKKPVPTPLLSMSVSFCKAALGIMVTGEGRPARYSGLTFRLPGGCPVSREWMEGLFHYLYRRYPRNSEDSRHLLNYIDFFPEYTDQLMKNMDIECIRKADPYIASDSFFGSVGTYMQEVTKLLELKGIHIRTKPNPGFLDCIPQPNERNMAPLSKLTAQKKGDIGLFYSGDGSLMGAVSPKGQIIRNEWACAVILNDWLECKGKEWDLYTEIFTSNVAQLLLERHNLKAMPLHMLKEENKPLEKAIIWDRKGLRFGNFLPDWDGIFQSMLLLQLLCKYDLNWQMFLQHMEELTEGRVQEQKSINITAQHWEEKQKDLLKKIEEIHSAELEKTIEEGEDIKLVFQDGTWLGFRYNEIEKNLFLYYDAKIGQNAEKMLIVLIEWLTS